jgi:hypothetical protein
MEKENWSKLKLFILLISIILWHDFIMCIFSKFGFAKIYWVMW